MNSDLSSSAGRLRQSLTLIEPKQCGLSCLERWRTPGEKEGKKRVRWRAKIVLNFNLMAKRRRIRIVDQHPRAAARQKMRQQGQFRFHRLRLGRAGIEIVRHRNNGKQDADHTQQRQQGDSRPARTGTRCPWPRPEKQKRRRNSGPTEIKD